MSPKQASGSADIDRRSDVYALGCVTYEMLVGEPGQSLERVTVVLNWLDELESRFEE